MPPTDIDATAEFYDFLLQLGLGSKLLRTAWRMHLDDLVRLPDRIKRSCQIIDGIIRNLRSLRDCAIAGGARAR